MNNKPKPDLSVVIPVFNEGAMANRACAGARRTLTEAGFGHIEIILVDDGSTDGGLDKKPAEADLLIRHRRNRGYGAALKTGFAQATGDIIVFLDADGTYDPKYIPELISRLNPEAPMAVGARTAPGSSNPPLRRAVKWILRSLANYLAGRRIPDLNSGLRAVYRVTLMEYQHLLPEGFSLTTTLTLALLCDGYDVQYIPIKYEPRVGNSKIHPLRDTQQILITILRTIMYFNPLKILLPLSGFLALGAIMVLIFSFLFLERVMDGTVSVLALSSFQSIGLGLLADAIGRSSRPCPHRGKMLR